MNDSMYPAIRRMTPTAPGTLNSVEKKAFEVVA